MPNRSNISIPLALSNDTRGGLAYANMVAGKDQRRVNCIYEITRASVGVPPDVVLTKRPGVTIDAGTYGAGSQVQFLVARDPAGTWDPTAWVFVEDGTNCKVVNSSTSTTILNDTNYQPRFWETININGVENILVQLQNIASPSGTPAQKTYTSTAIATWTEIADADYTGLSHRGKIEAMDGFLFQAEARHRIYQSNVNNLGTWSTNDYLTKSISQDPPQGLAKIKNQILFFGVETVEMFTNQGNTAGSVLGRVAHTAQRVGLGSVAGGGSGLVGKTSYYVTLGDFMFFAGRFAGQAVDTCCIAYNGSRFEKISRPYEDKLLSSTTVYGVHRIAFRGCVGVAFQLTLPTAATQRSLVFFPDLNDWFEFESTVWSPVNNGTHYAGIANTQKLYTFPASDNWQDDGTNFTMTAQFRIQLPDGTWHTMPQCGLIADTAGSTLNLGVQFSDDDGVTWSTSRDIDLSQARKELFACGGFRERMVRITHTGSGEVRLRKFFASIGS